MLWGWEEGLAAGSRARKAKHALMETIGGVKCQCPVILLRPVLVTVPIGPGYRPAVRPVYNVA
jgi:hypothetical protein